MGIFSKISEILGEQSVDLPWKMLSSETDLTNALDFSKSKPQIIFKHSTACSISFFAKREVEKLDEQTLLAADVNVVDVIRSRALSMYLADELKVRHESPQVIVVFNNKVIWHGSHSRVTADNIRKAISGLQG